jgi:hypothetical protein
MDIRINDEGNPVPDNHVLVVPSQYFDISTLDQHFESLSGNKKRDWFTPEFYRCLPMSIGNQQGFVVKANHSFRVFWDGRDTTDSVHIYVKEIDEGLEVAENLHPSVKSYFGHGTITLGYPLHLITPPGVNLMTINPPNYVIPNITVLTGVVETDNLRTGFSFTLKIQEPHKLMEFPKGTPLAAFIPIPRYFADSFTIKSAYDVMDKDLVDQELEAAKEYQRIRIKDLHDETNPWNRLYLNGVDPYGNKFKDHQRG